MPQVAILAKQSAGSASGSGQANGQKSATSALCPVPGQIQKSLPAVIHDERGNTLYEEPCIAWLHIRIVQASLLPLQLPQQRACTGLIAALPCLSGLLHRAVIGVLHPTISTCWSEHRLGVSRWLVRAIGLHSIT